MYYSSIAQQVEQSAVNRSVVGSSPTRGAIQGPLVKRLRHRPFTAVSGVRFPHGSPYGRLAQLGERLPYKQDVGSSILSSSTIVGTILWMVLFFYVAFGYSLVLLCRLWRSFLTVTKERPQHTPSQTDPTVGLFRSMLRSFAFARFR